MSLVKGARARGEEQALILWVVGGGRITTWNDSSSELLLHQPTAERPLDPKP